MLIRGWALGWIGLLALQGVQAGQSVSRGGLHKSPDMSTSTSWMWLLQLETATWVSQRSSLSKRRLTEMSDALDLRVKGAV